MLHVMTAVVALVTCSAPSHPSFGVLGFQGDRPTVFSTVRLEDGQRLAAYRIGTWTRSADVVIKSATRNPGSRLFDSEGNSVAWEHEISTPASFSGANLWICLPTDLNVAPAGKDGTTLTKHGEQIGTIRVSVKSEGLEFTLDVRGKTERVYYYLGYDTQ